MKTEQKCESAINEIMAHVHADFSVAPSGWYAEFEQPESETGLDGPISVWVGPFDAREAAAEHISESGLKGTLASK